MSSSAGLPRAGTAGGAGRGQPAVALKPRMIQAWSMVGGAMTPGKPLARAASSSV